MYTAWAFSHLPSAPSAVAHGATAGSANTALAAVYGLLRRLKSAAQLWSTSFTTRAANASRSASLDFAPAAFALPERDGSGSGRSSEPPVHEQALSHNAQHAIRPFDIQG